MKKLCAFLMTAVLIATMLPWGDDIASDAQALRETNRAANLDLKPIVHKHIPAGAAKKLVELNLKNQGFELYYRVGDKGDRTSELFAIRPMKKRLSTLFGVDEEIRLIVVFNNDMVKTASGKLIYRGV